MSPWAPGNSNENFFFFHVFIFYMSISCPYWIADNKEMTGKGGGVDDGELHSTKDRGAP